MKRLALMTTAVVVLFAPCSTWADEPYRQWLDFFEGKWTVEWNGQWEPFTFRYTSGKYAVMGEATTADGTRALAVYAWDAGKKALVFNWFDSKGNRAKQEMTVFENARMSGLLYQSGPDGVITGSSTVERKGPDAYTVTLKIVDAKGDFFETSGKMTRIKD